MTAMVDVNTIPNLPGYNLKRRQKNYHKGQVLQVHPAGVRYEKSEGYGIEKCKVVRVPQIQKPRRVGQDFPESTTADDFKGAQLGDTSVVPAWSVLDKAVLRFFGFFKEAVTETNWESHRVRQIELLFYLEDDTAHVVEPKQDNSGIPQGQFIKRHRFPGPSGDFLQWQDLQVGMNLQVYGRNIRLVDADPFTRDWFEEQGMTQAAKEGIPEDAFASAQKTAHALRESSLGIPRTHEKLYREMQLGGGHVNENMQQFMEWDGKVCRFFAMMDDVSTSEYERRPFVIMYYLADDTIEIREQYPMNAGRDLFPLFFGRQRVPREEESKLLGPMEQRRPKDAYVYVGDLAVGECHHLMGNNFIIFDADEYTRNFFQEELGKTLGEKVDVRLPVRTVPRPRTPPYNGYGSWEDSMGSIYKLMPKAPRKDFNKLYNNDGKILRFTARFVRPRPEHVDRVFIVNFHLFDDTVSIHEPSGRNSGIVTGKFLEKGVHINQITGGIFQPTDLQPGSMIKVYNQEFEILSMDEYTRKFMEENFDGRRDFDLQTVLEKVREAMRQQFPLVRDIFRRFDSNRDGVITVKEFQEALSRWGFNLAPEEAVIVMKHFDARKDGQISYNEFCDALLDQDYTTDMLKPKAPLDQARDDDYARRVQIKEQERAEVSNVRQAVRALGDGVYKHTQVLPKLIRELGLMTHLQTVSCEQLWQALCNLGFTLRLEDIERSVCYCYPQADLNAVPYADFFKVLRSNYHDLAATR